MLGTLNALIDESSGISASARFPERLYHTNDSWKQGPEFFISDLQGAGVQRIPLDVPADLIPTIDLEDMDVGPCEEGNCIFLADIGDNDAKRPFIHMLIFAEAENFENVRPRVLTLQYPDTAHDAEAFALHPNGDMYILTKEVFPIRTPPARLYRLKREAWQAQMDTYTLEFVTEIDMRILSGSSVEILSHIVTGMDISADGQRVLILTYGEAFEVAIDFADLPGDSNWPVNTAYKKIEILTLLQQESITYTAQNDGFIYTAEVRGQPSPLMQMSCLR